MLRWCAYYYAITSDLSSKIHICSLEATRFSNFARQLGYPAYFSVATLRTLNVIGLWLHLFNFENEKVIFGRKIAGQRMFLTFISLYGSSKVSGNYYRFSSRDFGYQ